MTPPDNPSQDGKSVEERMKEKAEEINDHIFIAYEADSDDIEKGIKQIEQALLEAFNEGREETIKELWDKVQDHYWDSINKEIVLKHLQFIFSLLSQPKEKEEK